MRTVSSPYPPRFAMRGSLSAFHAWVAGLRKRLATIFPLHFGPRYGIIIALLFDIVEMKNGVPAITGTNPLVAPEPRAKAGLNKNQTREIKRPRKCWK